MATPEQYISNVTKPLSAKQTELLRFIAKGNPDGSPVDAHQIKAAMSYAPELQAVNFSLRYMLAQKRVYIDGWEKRSKAFFKQNRPFAMKTYKVTPLGLSFITTL